VVYYSTIITSVMMRRDDPGETERPCLRTGCHNKLKEKWDECYMKNVFTLGMKSTQLSESLNNDLRFISNLILISSVSLSILKGGARENKQ
jgi:hypothetical protein